MLKRYLPKSTPKKWVAAALKKYISGQPGECNIRQIDVCTKFYTLPMVIQGDKVVVAKGSDLHLFWLTIIIQWTLTIVLFFRVVGRSLGHGLMDGETYTLTKKVLDFGWLTFSCTNLSFRSGIALRGKETVTLLNSAISMEMDMMKRGIFIKNDPFLHQLFFLGYQTLYVGAFGTAVLAFLNPCMPTFLSSAFLSCEGGVPQDNQFLIIGRILSSFVEGTMVYFDIAAGVVGNINLMGHLYMQMRVYLTNLAKIPITTLTESTVYFYRYLQVFFNLKNYCMASTVVPTFIINWSVMIVVGWFTGLKLFGIAPLPIYLLFCNLAIDGVIIQLTLVKGAGDAFERSRDVVTFWKTCVVKRGALRKSVEVKYLKSFPPLKVRIGATNFFELKTPLVQLDFCASQLVTLLVGMKS